MSALLPAPAEPPAGAAMARTAQPPELLQPTVWLPLLESPEPARHLSAWRCFWRASLGCWHPRVLLLSVPAMLLAAAAVGVLGWLAWEPAMDGVRDTLAAWSLSTRVLQWLHGIGAPQWRALIAPMAVVALAMPLVLVAALLMASALAPAVARHVAWRHYRALAAHGSAGRWPMLGWTLACTAAALLALVLSMPLWLLPPLVLVLPPLIGGWLASRVLAFNVLAHHASAAERRRVMRQRRWTLLAMGAGVGYLASAPSLVFAAGTAALMLAPLLAIAVAAFQVAVFMFAACWFAHVCLAELQRLRQGSPTVSPPAS